MIIARRTIGLFSAGLLAVFVLWATIVAAQTGVGAPALLGGENDSPIQIDAPGGIEWQQEEQAFIAMGDGTGSATAIRGTTTIKADELRAYYRDGKTGGSEIWRLDANGNVRMTAPGWEATGGRAVYDVTQAVIVLSDANPVVLVSGEDRVTATGQVEFWRAKNIAVARDNATAIRGERQIRADVLTAKFETDAQGKDRVRLLEGFDNVVITTASERVEASRAAYNVQTGLARMDGNVTISQGENQLTGCSADFDLNTSVSRLKSCAGTGSGQRVRGILMPGAKSSVKSPLPGGR